MQSLESCAWPLLRKNGGFVNPASLLHYLYEVVAAEFVALEIAAHTSFLSPVGIGGNRFSFLEVGLLIHGEGIYADSEPHY